MYLVLELGHWHEFEESVPARQHEELEWEEGTRLVSRAGAENGIGGKRRMYLEME
jgi:hypothetical protein